MEKVRLGDIASVITKGTTPTSLGFNFVNDGINFIKIESITEDGCFIKDKFAYITDECNEKLSRSQLKENDILFSIAGAIGRVAIVDKSILPANTNQALAIIRVPKELYEYCFLKYILKSPVISQQFEKQKQGVAQINLSLQNIGDFVLPILPLEKQKQISNILDKVTNLISKRKQQLEKLDELVKARFVELFGTLNDNEKGLDIVSIEELCTLIKDGTHQTPTYTEDTQNGFKFLSSKDVMTQKICWDDIKYIPAELHEKLYATIQPKRNDILMSKNGVNYGIAAVNDTDEVFDIYVSLALLRPRTDRVNPVYIRCAINNPDTKRQFDSSIKGIGVPNLHLGEIKKTKLLLPPRSKQNEFVAFVEQTDKSKLAIQQSLDKLVLLKKALLQEFFG